jgi:hypothetical protein
LFRQDLCIDEGLEVRDGGGFRKGLEELIRVLEFQVVREGEKVPALVEKAQKSARSLQRM